MRYAVIKAAPTMKSETFSLLLFIPLLGSSCEIMLMARKRQTSRAVMDRDCQLAEEEGEESVRLAYLYHRGEQFP